MLNNLTNFFNLITGRKIKTVPADTDLIALGTRDPRYDGQYQPSAIEYADLKADILNQVDVTCLSQFSFKLGSVGEKVSFAKTSGSDPNTNKDVIIPGQLEITRGNSGGGIYNIAIESNSTNSSPADTTWNTQYLDATNTSWAPLWDIENRTYITWKNAIQTPSGGNQAPPQYVGMHSIMKFDNGGGDLRYWLIVFTEWGVGNYNQEGAFAYDRWEIFPSVAVTKNDYDNTFVDVISDGVHITRANNGPLYNAVTDPFGEPGVSPSNTRWNSIYTDSRTDYSGFNDLSNLENRVYTDFTNALDYNIGTHVLNTDLIMHDLTTDLYYKVVFTQWTSNNNGGGFEYTRTVIPQSCSVKFADGSVLNTAQLSKTGGVQSVTDNGGGGVAVDNTDPLNPVVGFTGVFVDGTMSGNGNFGTPLSANYQAPAVDGITITGDGTPGNPLVASGGGGGAVNYANVIFVDSTNGNDTTGAINDFTKPYATLDYALSIAAITGASFSARGLIYLRKGVYYVSSQGSPSTFVDYFDMYSDLGVVITAFGYGRISDINSAGPVNVNFMGYADLNECDIYITRASTVNFQVNSIINTASAFLVIPSTGTANFTLTANKVSAQGLGTAYGSTVRNSSNVTINIREKFEAPYCNFFITNHSGRLVVNCPKIAMTDGNPYGYGGTWKQAIKVNANLGGEMIFNGDLVNEDTSGYYGGISGMITRFQDSWGTLRLNGSIYSGDTFGINAQGTSAASRTIVNGDVRTNHLCAYVGNSSQVILRNGTLMSWNTYSAALLYPILAIGGTTSGLYVENCNMYSLGTGGAGGINKDTQASTLVVNNVLYSGADTVGYFVINTVGGQPINNARFNNVRSSKPLDTNITDLLSPTGFILDTNTLAPNFI